MRLLTYFFFIIPTLLYVDLVAQDIDYLEIRSEVNLLSCGSTSEENLIQTKKNLLRLDSARIESNIEEYYYDLAMCYSKFDLLTDEINQSDSSLMYKFRAFSHKPDHSPTLWSLAFHYLVVDNNCEKGRYYLNQYKKHTPNQYWDYDQIDSITKYCN